MRQVAAAILFNDTNQVFIARRSSTDALAGKWEFPGGKLEPGETPEACLHREMMEEFGITIRIDHFYAKNGFEYKGKQMELLGYLGCMTEGDVCLNVHDEVRWVEVQDLDRYEFAPADIPFVRKLMKRN
jgi:8-oxo-dGTP diphosphatase